MLLDAFLIVLIWFLHNAFYADYPKACPTWLAVVLTVFAALSIIGRLIRGAGEVAKKNQNKNF